MRDYSQIQNRTFRFIVYKSEQINFHTNLLFFHNIYCIELQQLAYICQLKLQLKKPYMIKLSKKNTDNVSVAPSRSTMRTKSKYQINNQEEAPPAVRPYFRDDPLLQQIYNRAERQNKKLSPKPMKTDHLGKVSQIVESLHKKRLQTKKRLQNLKQQAEKQIDKKYPFEPQKRKLQKYIVTGDVVRRNQIWLQEKNKRHLELIQTQTIIQLKDCTFTPKMSAKKQSQSILKNRSNFTSLTPKKSQRFQNQNSSFYSPSKARKRDISQQEYQTAKRFLVNRIMNSQIY